MQTHRLAADRVVVAEGPAELVEAAARDIADTLRRRLTVQPTVSIALSGGTTPGPLYARLAAPPYRHLIDWSRLQVFWCDERCVAPDDPASNYRLVTETLLADLPRMPEVYRMKGELPAGLAAQAYARELAEVFRGPLPWFDLVLLGMGGRPRRLVVSPLAAAGGIPLGGGDAKPATAPSAYQLEPQGHQCRPRGGLPGARRAKGGYRSGDPGRPGVGPGEKLSGSPGASGRAVDLVSGSGGGRQSAGRRRDRRTEIVDRGGYL